MVIPLIFHNSFPKVPQSSQAESLGFPQLLMAGPLGIEGRKLRLWSRMKNSRLHSLLRAPAKKKFFTTKDHHSFGGVLQLFFSSCDFVVAWGFLALSCCKWWSAARCSFRYVASQGGRGWKRTTRCSWEQVKSSRRPGICWNLAILEDQTSAAKLWGSWGIFPYLIKP